MTFTLSTKKPTRKLTTRSLVSLLFSALGALLFCFQGSGSAQDDDINWQETYQNQNSVEWLDNDQLKLKPVEIANPRSAKSSNRAAIPRKRTGNPSNANSKTPNISKKQTERARLPWLTWIFLGVVLTVVAACLIWAFLRLGRRARHDVHSTSGKKYVSATAEQLGALPLVAERPVGDWLSFAHDERKKGNFDSAIMYLYSHLLLILDRHELIRLACGKTNRKYLSELNREKGLRKPFRTIMTLFEKSFFGNRKIKDDELDESFGCWEFIKREIDTGIVEPQTDLAVTSQNHESSRDMVN